MKPRESREGGAGEVQKAADDIEDLTEHAVMEPPPIPFAARDASIAKHQADLAAAPDLTEHAIAMDPPPISEEIKAKSIEQHNTQVAKQAEAKASEASPVKPEPAANNEAGPETIEQAQAFLAEDQREKMEVRQRLLKLYQVYTKEVLPQMQGIHDAAQKLGSVGADGFTKQEEPFAALQRGAKLQLDDTKTIQVLFTHLQTEAMGTTPQDIEARTRDVQLLTARLQMRMQSVQGFRNTLLSMRGGMPKGSAQEAALVGLDRVAGKSWKSLGMMQAEWQPIGGKVQTRNSQEYHKLYRQAYGVITSERSKGSDVTIQIPEDVQQGMPKEMIPPKEDLSNIQSEAIVVNIEGITQERLTNPSPAASTRETSPDISSVKTQEVQNKLSIEDQEEEGDEPASEADYQQALELRKKMDAAETIRVDVAKDVMRRTRRLSAELDGVKTKEMQVLQRALSDVLLEADTVAYSSSQKDRLDENQPIIRLYNKQLIKALQHADEVARSGGQGVSDDVRTTVRKLASFSQDLPELVESGEAKRAKKSIDRFEIQKKQTQKLPRISI